MMVGGGSSASGGDGAKGVVPTTSTSTSASLSAVKVRQRIGAAYGKEDMDDYYAESEGGVPKMRRRSNSMPMPKIVVSSTTAADDALTKENIGRRCEDEELLLAKESANVSRAASLGHGGKRRKKSIIGSGLEVSKLKHFKTFVESKILSKSDRCLDHGAAAASSSTGVDEALISPSSSEARIGQRRSSRSSFSEFDPTASPVSLDKVKLNLLTRKRPFPFLSGQKMAD